MRMGVYRQDEGCTYFNLVEGRHHAGIDDYVNIMRIQRRLQNDGVCIQAVRQPINIDNYRIIQVSKRFMNVPGFLRNTKGT